MNIQQAKQQRYLRRKNRTRAKLNGTAARPRLSVHRSLQHINAQLVDDMTGKTLVAATDRKDVKGSPTERAQVVGKKIAELAKEKGITEVIFDRGGRVYHGRIKALAEAAREAGLTF